VGRSRAARHEGPLRKACRNCEVKKKKVGGDGQGASSSRTKIHSKRKPLPGRRNLGAVTKKIDDHQKIKVQVEKGAAIFRIGQRESKGKNAEIDYVTEGGAEQNAKACAVRGCGAKRKKQHAGRVAVLGETMGN